jgi:glycosyltransferase involved in cell wall biosynthesis
MTNPLVSVAIITYNQKDFLIEAIDSVLAQDYLNIEIVVADDCSTDGTQNILQQYKIKYPQKFVLILSEINEGITKNSNKAHFACSGKYIAWLGGDDLMFKDKIRKQVEYMESHPDCNIVYHNLEVFDSDSGKIISYFNNKKNKYIGDVGLLIKHGTFNGACSNMVRYDKTPKHGFDEDLPVSSDWLYWIETLLNGGTICYIDEVLGKYRKHSKNVTNSNSVFFKQAIKDHLLTLLKIKKMTTKYDVEIYYALSYKYMYARVIDYKKNLLLSLKYNPLNIKALIYLSVYFFSFTKIKL